MMKRSRQSALFVVLGLTVLGGLDAPQALTPRDRASSLGRATEPGSSFVLVPVNASCLPAATGRATVFLREDRLGVDTLQLDVSGLPSNTGFSVFLTSVDAFATPPFGAAEYVGDFTTNAAGIGSLRVNAIVAEAFVSRPQGDPPVRVRSDLDHLVFWFSDPAQVPPCFNFSGATPFDGDGRAGPAAMSSQGATGLEVFP
jgi:hypothetical protein